MFYSYYKTNSSPNVLMNVVSSLKKLSIFVVVRILQNEYSSQKVSTGGRWVEFKWTMFVQKNSSQKTLCILQNTKYIFKP